MRAILELFNLLLSQAGGKAVEGVRVYVVSVGGDALHCGRHGDVFAASHLDNILAIDDFRVLGDEYRSGRAALSGAREGKGKESKERGGTHFGTI